MGRQENVEIFEDTLALCKQNSTLRNAIEQSTKNRSCILKASNAQRSRQSPMLDLPKSL